MMDFLASDGFASVFPLVVALAGLYWALRNDTGKRIHQLEERLNKRDDALGQRLDKRDEALGQRLDKRDDALGQRIDKGDEALGQRLDRQEERARANHQELVGKIDEIVREISELKAAVSAIDAKLDERSSPRLLQVREPGADYPVGDDSAGSPDNPEDDPADVPGGAAEGDSAT